VTTTVGSVTCKVWLKGDKGTCTIDNAALAVGSYPVSATYGGDANLNGTSGTSASKLTVNKDASLTSASESPTIVTYGDESASVFSAAITTHYAETVPNAETVTVYVGSAKCTVSLSGARGLARSPTRPWPWAPIRCRPTMAVTATSIAPAARAPRN